MDEGVEACELVSFALALSSTPSLSRQSSPIILFPPSTRRVDSPRRTEYRTFELTLTPSAQVLLDLKILLGRASL